MPFPEKLLPQINNSFFIGGIDTDIGKSLLTGLLARFLLRQGHRVITQKLVQTGVDSPIAGDIREHRRLMGCDLFPEDLRGETCPLCFRLPASPHLAARREGRTVEIDTIDHALQTLKRRFDVVLLEGAGGLHVPLTDDVLTIDYLEILRCPLILVTSGRLGSINHTFATLEAVQHRNIPLAGLVFNHFHATLDDIRRDTLDVFRKRLKTLDRPGALVELPVLDGSHLPDIDFSPLFQ